jgi:hypothetical protein
MGGKWGGRKTNAAVTRSKEEQARKKDDRKINYDVCDKCGGKKRGFSDDYFIKTCHCFDLAVDEGLYDDEY